MARKKKARYEYRSKFEERLGRSLDEQGIVFFYEQHTYPITLKVPRHFCQKCGSTDIYRDSVYTPDFFLPKWVVEAKGRFTARDRKRVLALMDDWDVNVPFGMLFMRDNTLSKTSKTRYSDWCKANGIPYAIGNFPKEWLK